MDEYVKKLRAKIGHDPLLLPHSIVIVINENNEVLIEERSDDGNFDFPGGGVDLGETAEDAAKRELYEETGLEALSLEFFKLYSGEVTRYVYSNGDIIYGIDAVYICREYKGELKPQVEEVNRLKFFNLKDFNSGKISPRNQLIIKDLYKCGVIKN